MAGVGGGGAGKGVRGESGPNRKVALIHVMEASMGCVSDEATIARYKQSDYLQILFLPQNQ